MRSNRFLRTVTLLLTLTVIGCGFRSPKGQTSTGSNPPTGEPGASLKLTPTFSSISQNLFEQKYSCTACHGPGGKAADKPLTRYEDFFTPGWELVVPGNAEESWLILTLEHKTSDPMPPNKKLPADELSLIREWINQGALNN